LKEADVKLQFDLLQAADIQYKAALQIFDFEIDIRAELDADKSNNLDFSFTDIIMSHASNLKL